MIYAEPHIQTALYALLNEAIDEVPVRDQFTKDRTEQILWGSFTNSNNDTKRGFNQEWTYSIEVITKGPGTSALRAQELTQGVLSLILPTKQTTGLQLSETTGLQLLNIRLLNVVKLPEIGDAGVIHRRIITIGFKIHELN